MRRIRHLVCWCSVMLAVAWSLSRGVAHGQDVPAVQAQADAGVGADGPADADSDPDTDADADAGTDTDTDADTDAVSDSAPATGSSSVTVTAPTAPGGPSFTAVVAGIPIRIQGILHARIELAQPVQSFDNPTAVAPTSALNPAVLADPSAPNLSFQVQQTRLGLLVGEGSAFRGQVEIDFVHFDQSSPIAQAFPRIRIASLEWTFAEGQRLFIGQGWDLFGNATQQLLSHSFNLVGTLFRAGNIGFLRQQLGWSGRFGDVELAAAVGLQGVNTGPAFNNVEESLVPTGSARVMVHLGERSVIGISGIATGLRFTQAMMPVQYRPAFGGELFADAQIDSFNLHAELYVAQNLANTGALNLGFGRYGHDVVDVGGYLSGREQLGDHAITAAFGFAAVVNDGEVVPGYTPARPMGMPPTTLGTISPATGPGIAWNVGGHIGYRYSPLPGLSLVIEPYFFVTRFVLAPEDVALAPIRTAIGGTLGSMFQF